MNAFSQAGLSLVLSRASASPSPQFSFLIWAKDLLAQQMAILSRGKPSQPQPPCIALVQASIASSNLFSLRNVLASAFSFSDSTTACFSMNQIIFVYSNPNIRQRMSRWMQPLSPGYSRQKGCLETLTRFLKRVNPCLRPEKQSEELTNFVEKFNEISIYHDPYFGESFLLEHGTTGKLIILKKQRVTDDELEARLAEIEEISRFNRANIVSQTLIDRIHKVGFLWTKWQLYFAYDYVLLDLAKQFEYRITQNKNFSENEMINIIKGACNGFVQLETTRYSAVQMAHIYFTREGTVKVSHQKLFRYQTNLSVIAENEEGKGVYLSPEEMHYLRIGETDRNLSCKSDCYVFGMVLLSLMSAKYLDEVYDYHNCRIDQPKIETLLRNCKLTYSQRLIGIVEGLLMESRESRPSFRSVLSKLWHREEEEPGIEIELMEENQRSLNLPAPDAPVETVEESKHKNYLAGILYPKVGRVGEYFNDDQRNRNISDAEEGIVAKQRIYYQNRNSKYIGEGTQFDESNWAKPKSERTLTREGKGMYENPDGQLYLGEWKKGEMHGYGKLFWDRENIRYEGNFKFGKFHGRGTEYNGSSRLVGKADSDDEVDYSFIRMQKDNWIKYEGSFKEDKREGQGIVYFQAGTWMGNFRNGQPNGEGVYIANDQSKKKGVWQNGIFLR